MPHFHGVLQCINDAHCLYLVLRPKTTFLLRVIDLLTLQLLSEFNIEASLNTNYTPCVDDNCIYLPTNDGQILCIDKFSGSNLINMNIGSMFVHSNLCQDTEHLYYLCGIPITNGVKTEINQFSVCSSNKITGKKERQSQLMPGNQPYFTYTDKVCYVKTGNRTYLYNSNCEPILETIL